MGAVFAVFALSALCCFGGAMMAFVFAPGQAMRAFKIARMPLMDASAVEAAAVGDEVLVTGTLTDNPTLVDGFDFVAYSVETWQVTESEADDDGGPSTHGTWEDGETVVLELALDMDGQTLALRSGGQVNLVGPLREEIVLGDSTLEAKDFDQSLPDGSRRYQGLYNGDLTTVLGTKATGGGLVPDTLFLGDRPAFEAYQREAASGLLFSGLCCMLFSPLVLIGGLLGTILWRR
jgi:hypothetical protein